MSPAGWDQNAGSREAPFKTIGHALAIVEPGDTVIVGDGKYEEALALRRGGESDARRVTLRAENRRKALVAPKGRALTLDADYVSVVGLVFDAEYGNNTCVWAKGQGIEFIDCEIRRAGRTGPGRYGDGLQFFDSRDGLVENCYIHHNLASDGTSRDDSHGVRFSHSYDMVVRGCRIELCSGDCIQADPNREPWDNILIEGCELYGGRMPANDPFAHPRYPPTMSPGEDGIDTKCDPNAPRPHIVVRDCYVGGFCGPIGNAAAFNIKERCDAVIDRCTVFDSFICFRLRGPTSRGGSHVTVTNTVMHSSDIGVRYEDKIEQLKLWNNTWGGAIRQPFLSAGGYGDGFEVKNCLFLAEGKPQEAGDPSNLAVGTSAFVVPADHEWGQVEYHLAADSPAIDKGVALPQVKADRDGVGRPRGARYDVGAYERP
ncbi:MAG: right-handed parallel beta-helix repeat-containing protein [Armatimonadota bacterium]